MQKIINNIKNFEKEFGTLTTLVHQHIVLVNLLIDNGAITRDEWEKKTRDWLEFQTKSLRKKIEKDEKHQDELTELLLNAAQKDNKKFSIYCLSLLFSVLVQMGVTTWAMLKENLKRALTKKNEKTN